MARLRGGGKRRGSGRCRRRRGRERRGVTFLRRLPRAAADGEERKNVLGRGGRRRPRPGERSGCGCWPRRGRWRWPGSPCAAPRRRCPDDAGEDDPDLGEAVDPARDAGADEAAARGVAEVVAVAGDEVVGVAGEVRGEVRHDRAHLGARQLRRPHQDRLPEGVPRAPPRRHLEDPAPRPVVRPVRVLHPMNCSTPQT